MTSASANAATNGLLDLLRLPSDEIESPAGFQQGPGRFDEVVGDGLLRVVRRIGGDEVEAYVKLFRQVGGHGVEACQSRRAGVHLRQGHGADVAIDEGRAA